MRAQNAGLKIRSLSSDWIYFYGYVKMAYSREGILLVI